MSDEIVRKRVTLHPSNADGSMDINTNLYPKTFIDGIVDREGNEVEVATKADLAELPTEEEVALKANDDEVIHLAGDETITGSKTFKEADIELTNGSTLIATNVGRTASKTATVSEDGFEMNTNSHTGLARQEDKVNVDTDGLRLKAEGSGRLLAENYETKYRGRGIEYNPTGDEEGDVYNLDFPEKSGTIATTDDVGGIEVLKNTTFEYDENNDETFIMFPPNIMPWILYDDECDPCEVFFDYQHQNVLDGNGDAICSLESEMVEDGVTCWEMTLPGHWGTEITLMEFHGMIQSGNVGLASTLNTYNMYHQSGGGGASLDVVKDIQFSYEYEEDPEEHYQYINHSTLIFPKNILPLRIVNTENDSYLYFNYKTNQLLGSKGNVYDLDNTYEIGELGIGDDGSNQVTVYYYNNEHYGDYGGGHAELKKENICVEYMLHDDSNGGNGDLPLNTYYLFNNPADANGVRFSVRTIDAGTRRSYIELYPQPGMLIKYLHFYYRESYNGGNPVMRGCDIVWNESTWQYELQNDSGSIHNICSVYTCELNPGNCYIKFQSNSGSSSLYQFSNGEKDVMRFEFYSGSIC